ncbi:hypothetical protein BJX62DRAFT_45527 [Aspergillus germanicus]
MSRVRPVLYYMALPYSLFPPVPVLPPPCVLLLLLFCLIHPFLPPSFSYTVRGLVRLNLSLASALHKDILLVFYC